MIKRRASFVVLGLLAALPAATARAQDADVDGGVALPVTPPRLLEFVQADYPPEAEAAGIEAAVVLSITIGADGLVTEAAVVAPAGHGFDEAALDAVQRFVFEPARRGEVALAARIRYRYVFELRQVAPPEPETPPPGRLEGRVLSARSGEPLEAVEVILSLGEEARRAVTTAEGTFAFADLPAGQYGLRLFARRHDELDSTEQVGEGETTAVVYRMSPTRDPNTFGAVAVVDAPPREVVRRTILREELTRIPGTRGDALRTIELLPGVGRPPFGLGALIIRGSAPGDSQALLDGIPVPLLYHFGGLTSFINSRLLERIDFVPGNFSVRYGRKLGGIVEVESRDPATDGVHGALDINILDSSLFVEGPIGSDASVAIAGRRSYIDFFFDSVVPSEAFDVVAAPVYYDYQAVFAWRPSSRDQVRALVYGSNDRLELVFADPADADPAVRGNLDLSMEFHRIFLQWKRSLSSDVDQEVQVAVGPTALRFGIGDAFNFDLQLWQTQLRSEWRARLTSRVQVTAGLDLAMSPFELAYNGPAPQQTEGNGRGMDPISGRPQFTSSVSGVVFRPGIYLESDLRPVDPLRIVLGTRLDYYSEIGRWSFDPRAVAIVDLDDTDRLKMGIGVFSQPPQFQESNPSLGNPEVRPSHALHLGLGYERDLAEGVLVGMELFYKQLWDRVVGTDNGVAPRFVNGGIGRIYGVELSAHVEPRGRRWFGFLSYTLSRSERRDLPGEAWRLFDFDQTHILSVAVVVRLGAGWELGGTFRLVTGNPGTPIVGGVYHENSDLYRPIYGEVNSIRSPWFHRLDVRVEKQWTFDDWKFALYLDVQNSYNSTNPEGQAYQYDFRRSAEISGLPIIPSLGVRGEL